VSLVHNERIKLLATASNNRGVGAILAGAMAPIVGRALGGPAHVVAWLVFGTDLMTLAR